MQFSRRCLVQNLLHDIQAAGETRSTLAASSLAQRQLFLRALRDDVQRRKQAIFRANARECNAYGERGPRRAVLLSTPPSPSTATSSVAFDSATAPTSVDGCTGRSMTHSATPTHEQTRPLTSVPPGTPSSPPPTAPQPLASSSSSSRPSGHARSAGPVTPSTVAPSAAWQVSASGASSFTSPLMAKTKPAANALPTGATAASPVAAPASPTVAATVAAPALASGAFMTPSSHEQTPASAFTSGGSGLQHRQFSQIQLHKLCAMIDYLLTLPDPLAIPETCWLNTLSRVDHDTPASSAVPRHASVSSSDTHGAHHAHIHHNNGETFDAFTSDPSIDVCQIPVPIGLVGVLSRYRPRMCVDAVAMGILTGNAMLIDGGSTLHCTNLELMESVHRALALAGLPPSSVVHVETYGGRSESTAEWLKLTGRVDLGLVCGPPKLYQFATEVATIPLLRATGHAASLYVDQSALFDMALEIILNSKFQKHAAANSVTTLIVHQNFPRYAELLSALAQHGVVILGDRFARDRAPDAIAELISEEEYNGLSQGLRDLVNTICVKSVDSLEQALLFLDLFGAKQVDGIIASDTHAVELFCRHVDSCAVLVNASTRLSSGVSLGCGPDLAVATSKTHCRGPITVSTLTTTKFLVKSRTPGQAALRK